jgi:hypothetical protein
MRIVVMAVLVAGALAAAENSVTGTWDVQTEVMGNAGSAVCTLTQDGEKIGGKCAVSGKDWTVTGEIAGEKVTFKHDGEYEGQSLTITYAGKFESATVVSGDVNVQPFEVAGTFKATRKE